MLFRNRLFHLYGTVLITVTLVILWHPPWNPFGQSGSFVLFVYFSLFVNSNYAWCAASSVITWSIWPLARHYLGSSSTCIDLSLYDPFTENSKSLPRNHALFEMSSLSYHWFKSWILASMQHWSCQNYYERSMGDYEINWIRCFDRMVSQLNGFE